MSRGRNSKTLKRPMSISVSTAVKRIGASQSNTPMRREHPRRMLTPPFFVGLHPMSAMSGKDATVLQKLFSKKSKRKSLWGGPRRTIYGDYVTKFLYMSLTFFIPS